MLKTKKLACGTVMETYAGGLTIQRNVDGSSMEIHEDGTRLANFTNGITQLTKPGGYMLQTWSDGRRLEQFADGRRIQTQKSGAVLEVASDGTKTMKPAPTSAGALPKSPPKAGGHHHFRRRKSSLRLLPQLQPLNRLHKLELPQPPARGRRGGSRRSSSFPVRLTKAPLLGAAAAEGGVGSGAAAGGGVASAGSGAAESAQLREQVARLTRTVESQAFELDARKSKLLALNKATERDDRVKQSALRSQLKSSQKKLAAALQRVESSARRVAELEASSTDAVSSATAALPPSPHAHVTQLLRAAHEVGLAAELDDGATEAISDALAEIEELARARAKRARTRWPRGWDPAVKIELLDGVEELSSEDDDDDEAPSGGELWLKVLAFGGAPAACALGATTSAMHSAVVRSSAALPAWRTILQHVTDALYGRWAMAEVLSFLDEVRLFTIGVEYPRVRGEPASLAPRRLCSLLRFAPGACSSLHLSASFFVCSLLSFVCSSLIINRTLFRRRCATSQIQCPRSARASHSARASGSR